jgi:hypothetical protein
MKSNFTSRKATLHVNPTAFADRRTAEQRRHADSLDEKFWRWRVRRNEERRGFGGARPAGPV